MHLYFGLDQLHQSTTHTDDLPVHTTFKICAVYLYHTDNLNLFHMSSDNNSNTSGGEVSIRLTHELDEEAEYGGITSVHVKIFVQPEKKAVGFIEAIIVDRQSIPERLFYSAFDSHSSSLQSIGCKLLEPRSGRTNLVSLAEWDDPEFDFMLIDKFHVDDAYKLSGSSSDVAAKALHQFLHHPFIKGSDGELWNVSSVAYEVRFSVCSMTWGVGNPVGGTSLSLTTASQS